MILRLNFILIGEMVKKQVKELSYIRKEKNI